MVYQRIIDFSRQSAVVTFKLLRALISNELNRGEGARNNEEVLEGKY